jgi:hypothetical protein
VDDADLPRTGKSSRIRTREDAVSESREKDDTEEKSMEDEK